jgi:hypothetical protein
MFEFKFYDSLEAKISNFSLSEYFENEFYWLLFVSNTDELLTLLLVV